MLKLTKVMLFRLLKRGGERKRETGNGKQEIGNGKREEQDLNSPGLQSEDERG